MRYILIPDVHGRDFWRKHVEHRNPDDIVVFLGDYVDPYPDEKITNKAALQGLKDIIELKKSDPEHIILLLGNHDLGYMTRDFCNARHWYKGHDQLHEIFFDNIDLFILSYVAEGFLISHAGVYPHWLEQCGIDLKGFDDFNDQLHEPKTYDSVVDKLYYIDRYRGGWFPVGSPVWADIRCALRYDNLDMNQIVGHTQLIEGPLQINKMICIDCRRVFILEDGRLKNPDGTDVNIIKQ